MVHHCISLAFWDMYHSWANVFKEKCGSAHVRTIVLEVDAMFFIQVLMFQIQRPSRSFKLLGRLFQAILIFNDYVVVLDGDCVQSSHPQTK